MTSLATLRNPAPSLADLVDGLSCRSGAWIIVERFGSVEAYGAGAGECPSAVAKSLLSKRTKSLSTAVTWSRGGRSDRLSGSLEGGPVLAADLGNGAIAWIIGATPDEVDLEALAFAADRGAQRGTDPVVYELLHPRGPTRPGRAPEAVLVAMQHDGPITALSREVVACVAGTAARVHTEEDVVLVALEPGSDALALVKRVARHAPRVVAGIGVVHPNANDWVDAAQLARSSAQVAAELGLGFGDPSDPAVAAELGIGHAQRAVAELLRDLSDSPLRRLEAYDRRTSSQLVTSLAFWCRTLYDVRTAAEHLHVHPNTLRYRIKRASQVSGLDLSRSRQLMFLQLLLDVSWCPPAHASDSFGVGHELRISRSEVPREPRGFDEAM